MWVLQSYWYDLGTKTPFDQVPGMVEAFLHSAEASARYFHYHLESLDLSGEFRARLDGTQCQHCSAPPSRCSGCREEAEKYLRKGSACERAAKENPFLGPVKETERKGFKVQFLENGQDRSLDAKDPVYAVLPKLCRRYGFTEVEFSYGDIDFFFREFTDSAGTNTVITLHRSSFPRGNVVEMRVESVYSGAIPDGSRYAEELGKHLSRPSYGKSVRVLLDDGEKAFYEDLNAKASDALMGARALFGRYFDGMDPVDLSGSSVKLARLLKKLSRQYGYTYEGYAYYVYRLQKRLPGGHYVCVEFVSHPRVPCADPFVVLQGIGFRHSVLQGHFCPRNIQEAEEYLKAFFPVLADAEKTLFQAALEAYPPTPEWFVPG